MIQTTVLFLALCAGTLVEPFRIADAEPGHHQVCVRTAMAPDGRFAVAWADSLPFPEPWRRELDLYIRFFDPDGSPLTDAYKITKMVDTNWIRWPCLETDTAGNVVLVYEERDRTRIDPDNRYIRFQSFGPDGSPVGSAQTLVPQLRLDEWRPIGLSLANKDEFAVTWCAPVQSEGYETWVQRFNMDGHPKGNAFLAHDPDTSLYYFHPEVALNDAGDLVATWLEFHKSGETYPRFQVFDADNEPILDWEPMGYRVDDGEELYNGTRAEVHWLDDDRFVVFWIDTRTGKPGPSQPVGRVFRDQGLTRHPIRWLIWEDSLWLAHGGTEGWYSTAVSPNDSFAYTYIRSYTDYPDTSDPSKKRRWEHGAGILGYVQDNEPTHWTTLFEYTPPWGADTVNSYFDNNPHTEPPAVACCDNRIVWVYSRLNTDTIFEAYAMITDWDMGIGVEESAPKTVSPIKLSASLNRLSYDVPGQVCLTLYSADGRRVLEETIEGKGIWTPSSPPSSLLPSGVYFARVEGEAAKATAKLVILH